MSANEHRQKNDDQHGVATQLVINNIIHSTSLNDEQGPLLNPRAGHYFLSISRKLVSSDNCADQGIAPEYTLLIAFLTPPLLEIAVQAQRPVATQSHWTSHINLSRSRLSGWKEANTLYTHQHTRIS